MPLHIRLDFGGPSSTSMGEDFSNFFFAIVISALQAEGSFGRLHHKAGGDGCLLGKQGPVLLGTQQNTNSSVPTNITDVNIQVIIL